MYSNLDKITQSETVAFADFVRNYEREGGKIIKMQTGDPDFPTHDSIISAAHKAMIGEQTKYCDSRGLLPLRKAIGRKLLAYNKINASPEDNILVTHGAVHGIGLAIRALLNTGDECIIIEPFWRSYQMDVILSGGIPVIVQASPKNGFQLESDKIISKITHKTKIIIINTPNNPTGAVYDKTELEKLAKFAASQSIYIITDEVYESLIFDGNSHYSIASDDCVFNWIISAFSFSKTYAMTGWRLGYLVASKLIIDQLLKLSQFSVTSLAPFSQLAAIEALNSKEVAYYAEEMRFTYEKRRDEISMSVRGTWLEQAMTYPMGTFYALINTSRFQLTSVELAKMFVYNYGVAFTPGIAFGDNMDSYLRVCFATSNDNIASALNALISSERKLKVES